MSFHVTKLSGAAEHLHHGNSDTTRACIVPKPFPSCYDELLGQKKQKNVKNVQVNFAQGNNFILIFLQDLFRIVHKHIKLYH